VYEASDGDTVVVAPGVYHENVEFEGRNIILRSTVPLDDTIVESTTIDADQIGSAVIFDGREGPACLLWGFTIRNGSNHGYQAYGGGICGHHTHAGIENNVIIGNSATRGGGIWACDGLIQDNSVTENRASEGGGGLSGCNGTVRDNTIYNNSAEFGGGLSGCDGTVESNIVFDNSATGFWGLCIGGGIAFCDGDIRYNYIVDNTASNGGGGLDGCNGSISDNVITSNICEGDGGGLSDCDGSIVNNRISDNSASWSGGGLSYCDGAIRNNTILRNSAKYEHGGGLYDCEGTIEWNMIGENSSPRGGGLMYCGGIVRNNQIIGNSSSGMSLCDGTIESNLIANNSGPGLSLCDGTIRSNTIVGNEATYGGGLSQCSGTVLNCIIWGNAARVGAQLYESSDPTYSCIQYWTRGGQGNITEDPLFVDLEGADDDPQTYEDNDYRLLPDSPCVDAGANEEWMLQALDLDANPRVWRGRDSWTVDMGAYEHGYFQFDVVRVAVRPAQGPELTWRSRPREAYRVWSCSDLSTGVWVEEVVVYTEEEITRWADPSAVGRAKFYRVEFR